MLVHGLSLEDRPAAQWPGWRGSAGVAWPAFPGGTSQPRLSSADGLTVPQLNSTTTPLSPASKMSSWPGIQPPDPSVLDCVVRSAGAGPGPCPHTSGLLPTTAWVKASFPF